MSRLDRYDLASYEARDYGEVINTDGYVEYGADNLFPQYLVELYHESPTHTALVNSIAQMIYGEGFTPVDLDSRLIMQAWDMDSELRKCILDLKIQGGMAFEVIWSLDRSTISNVKHLAFENIRACEVDHEEKVHGYKYSTDWSDPQCPRVYLPCFNPEMNVDQPTQILYVKPFSPGSFYYPKPDYIGAIHYVELEKEIGLYHIHNIQNGLSPSFSIHFKNGVPSVEERNQIRNDIENQMSGTKGAGKVWITYSDLPEQKPDFEPIPLSDAHNQYQFLSEETTAKIMIGHRVTNPMMFGVVTPGKLGGGTELAESAVIFNRHVVQPARRIIESAIATLLNSVNLDARFVDETAEEEEEVEETPTEDGTELSTIKENLLDNGEDIGEDWELIDSRRVDYDMEDQYDALFHFARVPKSSPTKKSEQDGDLIKVRYAYAPTATDAEGESREFCKAMISAGKVYRKEDIIAAGQQSVNPGLGPRGSNTYSIWLFKGGANCHHFWERRTYLRKDNKRLTVSEARRIISSLPVKERDAQRIPTNDPRVARRPVDMPNQGYLR